MAEGDADLLRVEEAVALAFSPHHAPVGGCPKGVVEGQGAGQCCSMGLGWELLMARPPGRWMNLTPLRSSQHQPATHEMVLVRELHPPASLTTDQVSETSNWSVASGWALPGTVDMWERGAVGGTGLGMAAGGTAGIRRHDSPASARLPPVSAPTPRPPMYLR